VCDADVYLARNARDAGALVTRCSNPPTGKTYARLQSMDSGHARRQLRHRGPTMPIIYLLERFGASYASAATGAQHRACCRSWVRRSP
jgi:hypothetical protein